MEITADTALDEMLRAELRERGFAEYQHDTEVTWWTLYGTTDEYGNVQNELARVEAEYWPAVSDQPTITVTVCGTGNDHAYGVKIDRVTPPAVAQAILRALLDGGQVATPVFVEAARKVVTYATPAEEADFCRTPPRQRAGHILTDLNTLANWLELPALPTVKPAQWLLGRDWCVVRRDEAGRLVDVSIPVSHPVGVQMQQAMACDREHPVPVEHALALVRVEDLGVEMLDPQAAEVPFTVEIQAGGTYVDTDEVASWQAVHPAETVLAAPGTAEQVAADVATYQTVADGDHWRVCVWDGADADLGTEPTAIYEHQPATTS